MSDHPKDSVEKVPDSTTAVQDPHVFQFATAVPHTTDPVSTSASHAENFIRPIKAINNQSDFEGFLKSTSYTEILDFVKDCCESVVDVPNNSTTIPIPPCIEIFKQFMNDLYELVNEIPPMKQPMRFGNKSFRVWHTKLQETLLPNFLDHFLPIEHQSAKIELQSYILDMFGNTTRIDYGTGHELNFLIFFYCVINKVKLISKDCLSSVITHAFVSYIRTMRKLQIDYLLEPAGSHGVWGLDDYHCLLFLFGSAQLSKQHEIKPSSIHQKDILDEYSNEYLYLEGIQFIKKIKSSAPFAETSPMLNDISHMNDWGRICSGLMRLFQGEVMNKFPVIQHLLFGNMLKCTWKTDDHHLTTTTTTEKKAHLNSNFDLKKH